MKSRAAPDVDYNVVIRSIILVCAAWFGFSVVNASVKHLADHYSIAVIVFGRCVFAILALLPFVYRSGFRSVMFTRRPGLHLMRGVLGAVSLYFAYYSLSMLPLADAIAILFTVPLFMSAGASILLRETIGWHSLIALAAGFTGVLLIVQPEGNIDLLNAVPGVVASLATALANVLVRHGGKGESSETLVFWFMGGPALLMLFLLPFEWKPMALGDGLLLAFAGVVAGIGQIMLTRAYQRTEIGLLAPFDYSQMLWALAFGWLFWATLPNLAATVGMLLIAGGGLLTVYGGTRRPAVTGQ